MATYPTSNESPLSPLHCRMDRDRSPDSVMEEWRESKSSLICDLESAAVAGCKPKDKEPARTRKSSSAVKKTSPGRTKERHAASRPKKSRACGENAFDPLQKMQSLVASLKELSLGSCRLPATKDQGGNSYSPQTYDLMQAFDKYTSSPLFRFSLASLGLVGTPLAFYGTLPASSPAGFLQAVATFWDGCLLLSSRIVFACCLVISFHYQLTERPTKGGPLRSIPPKSNSFKSKAAHFLLHSPKIRFHRIAFCVMLFLIFLIGVIAPWTLIFPSWLWHPFLWGQYEVYWPSRLAPAMHGLCVDYSLDEGKNGRLPLCLEPEDWDALSTGSLSSRSQVDVEAVLGGIAYGKQQSGGIVVSVLARDVVDFIAPLRQNVESLVPFFSNVAVVIFENDSRDGSREAFKRWSSVVKGYTVDLIECADAVDCKFGKTHRDDVGDFSHSSAIGDMHVYRQRVVDYILGAPQYHDYSHMIVLDIDLGVSISPLGVLHTLGTMPDNPVASAGRQPWPTAFGSLITPYDMSAFRPHVTKKNARIVEAHEAFCHLTPPGDRWRNECDAFSPFQMIEMLSHDRAKASLVRVGSAFNGAVMYPLQLIRDAKGTYDAGDDGQRCEHVGFHFSLKKPMYMNRKWDMHLSPSVPGGPNGHRAQKTASRVAFTPKLALVLELLHFGFAAIFVWSSMGLGAFVVFPLLFQGTLQLPLSVMDKAARRRRHTVGVKMV